MADSGQWFLVKSTIKEKPQEDVKEEESVLAQGQVSALGTNRWHHLGLFFIADSITAQIDGVTVKTIVDRSFAKGMVGLGTVAYAPAEFDHFTVEPLTR